EKKAIISSFFTMAWLGCKNCIISTKPSFGQKEAFIMMFSAISTIGYLSAKYSSVTVVVVLPKYFSHFSRIVKIPMRMSATGRVNVKGNKLLRTLPSYNI